MSEEPRIGDELPMVTAAQAAASIPTTATIAVSGFGSVGYPKAVPLALAESNRELELTVISGGAVGDEIDTRLAESGGISRRYPYATREAIRDRINDGRTAFRDRHVSGIADDVRFGRLPSPDVAVVEAVAVGTDWLIPTTSIGQTPAFVETADQLVVEVNEAQPQRLAAFHDIYQLAAPPHRQPIPLAQVNDRIGGPRIPFAAHQLIGVIRTDQPDSTYKFRDPTPVDRAIGNQLATFLQNEINRNRVFEAAVSFEFGVGSVGNALLAALDQIDFGDRHVSYFGEVIQDGLLDALDQGILDSASATSLALSATGQQRLFDDLDQYTDLVVLRPAEISNNAALLDRFGVIAVNAAVEIDLYGHVNSTHLRGSELVGGLGGSGDFTRNGLLSVIACPSTARDGTISRIVPMATHVDHTEHDVDVFVTEHGIADIRGCSPTEAAQRIIHLADPSFKPDLQQYLDRAAPHGGHIHHDLPSAFDWQI